MAYEFKLTRRVEWVHTDMAGIMYFGNFFSFMEAAEHAFFRSLGFSIDTRDGERRIGWPRIHAECQYHQPARFEDELEVHLLVAEISEKTILYKFLFRKPNEGGGVIARGSIRVACV